MRTRLLILWRTLRHQACRTIGATYDRITERDGWHMRCSRCGWRSTGWLSDGLTRDHRVTQAGIPGRHRLARSVSAPRVTPPNTTGTLYIDGVEIPIYSASFEVQPAAVPDAELRFERETIRELQRGEHQKPVEWRGSRKLH